MKRWTMLVAVLSACHGEASSPTPTASASASATATATATATVTVSEAPVTAEFADLAAKPLHVEHVACEQRVVAIVSGKASALGDELRPGDLLLSQGKGAYDVTGSALVVVAITGRGTACEPNKLGKLEKKIIRATAAPELSWAAGKMHAHLDADDRAVAPFAYVGRLEGTAPVAEHAHEQSWEVLCAVEAVGTFTLAGSPNRLAPKTCVTVPPNTKHVWTPDAGTNLRAIQFYAPPGPEERFKALAAKEH